MGSNINSIKKNDHLQPAFSRNIHANKVDVRKKIRANMDEDGGLDENVVKWNLPPRVVCTNSKVNYLWSLSIPSMILFQNQTVLDFHFTPKIAFILLSVMNQVIPLNNSNQSPSYNTNTFATSPRKGCKCKNSMSFFLPKIFSHQK